MLHYVWYVAVAPAVLLTVLCICTRSKATARMGIARNHIIVPDHMHVYGKMQYQEVQRSCQFTTTSDGSVELLDLSLDLNTSYQNAVRADLCR